MDQPLTPPPASLLQLPNAARTRWRISSSIAAAFMLLLLAVPLAIVLAIFVTPAAGLAGIALLLLAIPIGISWANRRHQRFGYALGDETLIVRDGVLIHSESVAPLYRVQHIDIISGPLQLRFGLATLVIHTAAPVADIVLPDLHAADAEAMRDRILEASRRAAEALGMADVDAV